RGRGVRVRSWRASDLVEPQTDEELPARRAGEIGEVHLLPAAAQLPRTEEVVEARVRSAPRLLHAPGDLRRVQSVRRLEAEEQRLRTDRHVAVLRRVRR